MRLKIVWGNFRSIHSEKVEENSPVLVPMHSLIQYVTRSQPHPRCGDEPFVRTALIVIFVPSPPKNCKNNT